MIKEGNSITDKGSLQQTRPSPHIPNLPSREEIRTELLRIDNETKKGESIPPSTSSFPPPRDSVPPRPMLLEHIAPILGDIIREGLSRNLKIISLYQLQEGESFQSDEIISFFQALGQILRPLGASVGFNTLCVDDKIRLFGTFRLSICAVFP